MKRFLTIRITGKVIVILFVISALFSVLQVFIPAFIPNGSGNTFALTFPVQAETEEVASLDLCETAIYALYTAGILATAGIALKKHSKAFELTGILLLLASVLLGVWRIYDTYGYIPEFGSRISTPFYYGTILLELLMIDAAVGHRTYPLNFAALLIYAFLAVGSAVYAPISEIFEGGSELRSALILVPSFLSEALFSIALAFGIKAKRT